MSKKYSSKVPGKLIERINQCEYLVTGSSGSLDRVCSVSSVEAKKIYLDNFFDCRAICAVLFDFDDDTDILKVYETLFWHFFDDRTSYRNPIIEKLKRQEEYLANVIQRAIFDVPKTEPINTANHTLELAKRDEKIEKLETEKKDIEMMYLVRIAELEAQVDHSAREYLASVTKLEN